MGPSGARLFSGVPGLIVERHLGHLLAEPCLALNCLGGLLDNNFSPDARADFVARAFAMLSDLGARECIESFKLQLLEMAACST